MSDAIQKTLFGKAHYNLDTLVLTPIQLIFDTFRKRFNYESSGMLGTIGIIGDIGVIKTPVGRIIEDVIYYGPESKNILLLGCCGSFNPTVQIGDLFSCTTAYDKRQSVSATLELPLTKRGSIYQVATFHEEQEESFLDEIKSLNIDCVDMETYSVFKMAHSRGNRVGAAHVVTDTKERPFYKNTLADFDAISKAVKSLTELALETLIK